MESGACVRLSCERETLEALARGLTHYAPATGEPEWLVSGAWLCTKDRHYLASASVQVLPDGFVARSLDICTPEKLAHQLEGEIPNVAARLSARGNGSTLPAVEPPSPPREFSSWPGGRYETKVLVRSTPCASGTNRVCCGLLFITRDRSLLVGSDPSTLALVFSIDPGLIRRYREQCEELTPADYLTRT